MKLLAAPSSPYVRKVRIVLAEKKIDCPIQNEQPWENDNEIASYNPLGKVPVLVMDDGSALFDSRVITEYLDSISPVSRLYPKERHALIDVRRWEALADGICDAAVTCVQERRRPAPQQCSDWICRQEDKIRRGLAAMSTILGERLWCSGDSYSIADIAAGCALGYLDLRFADLGWRDAYPNLASLQDKLMARASFIETQAH